MAKRTQPTPGPGFDVYWSFAAERQSVYLRMLKGVRGTDLTTDVVLREHRFTNAFRASDRVSQFLIANVIYDQERDWTETFARVLIFKMFNRIDTWTYLTSQVDEVGVRALLNGDLDEVLAERAKSHPIYNAAYIMPPPRMGTGAKFRRHLELIKRMVIEDVPDHLASTESMASAFEVLRSYDSIGPFLAYQFLIDLNYSPYLHFSEGDYVVAGPGALRGIRKCFTDTAGLSPEEIIRWVSGEQARAFEERGLEWTNLWGRDLQLIDLQNLFCEVDKYTRRAHPELSEFAPGSRIKQKYTPLTDPMTAWFPPKWGLNESIPNDLWARRSPGQDHASA